MSELAKGFFFTKPREGAPDFVRGNISVRVDEAVELLQKFKNEKGYVNLDLLKSKDGSKLYLVVNEYKKSDTPKSSNVLPEYPQEEHDPNDIPF